MEALYCIFEGFWFSLDELIMTSLFHFEDKVHRRNLTRAESIPLLFPRLLCQVLEHLGFPIEPNLEHRRDCEAIFTVNRWQILPRAHSLPPQDLAEDEPADDHPVEARSSPPVPIEEPKIPASTAPAVTAPLPTSPASSTPSVPPAPLESTGPCTSAPPLQHISISPRNFLAIMDAVRTFSATSASFAAAHTTLAERMTRTEVVVAQTIALLAQNHAILMHI